MITTDRDREAAAKAILVEMNIRRLLNDVDDDLHEEVGLALADAALTHARAQAEPVAWVNESHRDSILERSGKVYWHAPMMCGQEFKGSFPVYLAAPAQEPVAVPAVDPHRACRAAEQANHRFGQWMPQRWLDLFGIM